MNEGVKIGHSSADTVGGGVPPQQVFDIGGGQNQRPCRTASAADAAAPLPGVCFPDRRHPHFHSAGRCGVPVREGRADRAFGGGDNANDPVAGADRPDDSAPGDQATLRLLRLFSSTAFCPSSQHPSGPCRCPAPVRESAEALGLPRLSRLKLIELAGFALDCLGHQNFQRLSTWAPRRWER